MQRRKNKNNEDYLDHPDDNERSVIELGDRSSSSRILHNIPKRDNSRYLKSTSRMNSIVMYESNAEILEDGYIVKRRVSEPSLINETTTEVDKEKEVHMLDKELERNVGKRGLSCPSIVNKLHYESIFGLLRRTIGNDGGHTDTTDRRRSSPGPKYSFMYEINRIAEESDSSQALLKNGRDSSPMTRRNQKNPQKQSKQLSWASAIAQAKTKDKALLADSQTSENNKKGCHRNVVDLPLRLAARELHAACWFDAPVEHVENLLYQHPEVLNDRTVDPFGYSPLEISTARALCCRCGCCNYNRNRVIAALNKGEVFYRSNKPSDNKYDLASDTCNASINTKMNKHRRTKYIKGDFQENNNNRATSTLTKAALKQREKEEFHLFSDRESAWIKHAPKFSKLQRTITELQREKCVISSQLNVINKQIEDLNSVSKNEPNLNFFEKLSSSRHNDQLATGYFKIGMANLDKSKLKASFLEVEVNLDKAIKDFNYLESVSFNGIDHRLEEIFGRKSLRNCAVSNEIHSFGCDNNVQQIEDLKFRFQ